MNCIYIGTFIKQRRKELKLTQEQVCSGICDPVTLSRIENGKQTPSKSVISALLQRLGMPEARYYVLESKRVGNRSTEKGYYCLWCDSECFTGI